MHRKVVKVPLPRSLPGKEKKKNPPSVKSKHILTSSGEINLPSLFPVGFPFIWNSSLQFVPSLFISLKVMAILPATLPGAPLLKASQFALIRGKIKIKECIYVFARRNVLIRMTAVCHNS